MGTEVLLFLADAMRKQRAGARMKPTWQAAAATTAVVTDVRCGSQGPACMVVPTKP